MDQAFNGARRCVTKRGAGQTGVVSYRSNESKLAFVAEVGLYVSTQGYQAGAEQIRQFIFSLANGVLWIMSWGSPVSSSVRFVA